MFLSSWFRSGERVNSKPTRRLQSTFVPRVEELEDRSVPSTMSVGSLNPTLLAQTTAPFSSSGEPIIAATIQGNGKTLALGLDSIARYDTGGSLDTTFGQNGFARFSFGKVSFTASAIALEPNGEIVVAGCATGVGRTQDFAVAEFHRDGTLDTSFGKHGIAVTDFNGGADWAFALGIQGNGQIVVAGNTCSSNGPGDFALARYNTNGSLDTSFGTGGLVTTGFADNYYDVANAIALQPNGQIVVVGESREPSNQSQFAVARYNYNGTLDSAFGQGGLVTTSFGSSTAVAHTVALGPYGTILVGGWAAGISGSLDFALARYQANGTLDASFGQGGLVTTDFAGKDDMIFALAIQRNGKILAVGSTQTSKGYDFAIARYQANGRLDTAFGAGGLVTSDFAAGQDFALAVRHRKDGTIWVAGASMNGADEELALAVFQASQSTGIG